VVVEQSRLAEQRLRERERASRVAGQQDALGEGGGGTQVDGALAVSWLALGHGVRL
jgi:hypothetical protein